MSVVTDHKTDGRLRLGAAKYRKFGNTCNKCEVGQSFIWPGKIDTNIRAMLRALRFMGSKTFITESVQGGVQIRRVE